MKTLPVICFSFLLLGSCANLESKVVSGPDSQPIRHDPEAALNRRRSLDYDREELKKKLAGKNLNVDSLLKVVNNLNQGTRNKEWEYRISTADSSAGQIIRVYKSHKNADGSSGRTIYGDEIRRQPRR